MTIGPDGWAPDQFHSVIGASRAWRITSAGVLVQGEPSERRTTGSPVTLTRISVSYQDVIDVASRESGIPSRLISAVLATESGGILPADRYEPVPQDWSYGLMQTLTATADGVVRSNPRAFPAPPEHKDFPGWKTYLDDPTNSIRIGAAYLRMVADRQPLQLDPILLHCV